MTIDIYNSLWLDQHTVAQDEDGQNFVPTLHDEVQAAILLNDYKKRLDIAGEAKTMQRWDRSAFRGNPQDEEYRDQIKLAKENVKNYDLSSTLNEIYKRHTEGADKATLSELSREFNSASLSLQKGKGEYSINSEWLNHNGNDMVNDTIVSLDRQKSYKKGTVEDYLVDLPSRVVKNTAGMVQMVYDAPKYFLDDEGDEFYHNVTRHLPMVGSALAVTDMIAGAEKNYLGGDIDYSGQLQENPHLAQSLEFAGELLLTLPLEGLAIAKMASRLGRKDVLKSLDRWKDETGNMFHHRIKRFYANARLNTLDEARRIGFRNVINRQKRDMYYATAAMAGIEGGIQTAFAYNVADSEGWLNYARMPAMLLGGALIPMGIHKGLQYASVVKGGHYSPIKDFRWNIESVAGGKDGSIDSYLQEVLGYSAKQIEGQSHLDKLRLAKITRQEWKNMENFGQAMLDLKRYDDNNGTELFEEIKQWLDVAEKSRTQVLGIRAKHAKDANGNYTYRKNDGTVDVDRFVKQNMKEVQKTDRFIDQMLVSESLRSIRQQLNGVVELPMMQRIKAKTLYKDMIRHNKVEAQQRDFIAETLTEYLDDAAKNGDDEAFGLFSDFQDLNNQKRIEMGVDETQMKAKAEEELAQLISKSSSLEEVGPVDLTNPNLKLSEDDFLKLNNQLSIMEELGYQPTSVTLKNLETFGNNFDNPLIPDSAKQSMLPSKQVDDTTLELWTKNYNRIRNPLNAVYKRAEKSAEKIEFGTKSIGENATQEQVEAMSSLFTRMQREVSNLNKDDLMLTGELRDARNFQSYIKRTMRTYIRTGAETTELDGLLKPVLAKNNKTIDTYTFTKGDERIEWNNASAADKRNHLLNVLEVEDVDIPLNVGTLQKYRSKMLDRAGTYIGFTEGREAANLAEDLHNIMEIASIPYQNDPGITTFLEANRRWNKEYVPLFRKGAGGKVAELGKQGRRVGDNMILDTFLNDRDPHTSIKQFNEIFGKNPESKKLLRFAMARQIEQGKTIGDSTIESLVTNNIVDAGLGEKLRPAMKELDREIAGITKGKALESFNVALQNSKKTTNTESLINKLNAAAQTDQSPEAIYNIFKNEPTATSIELLNSMGNEAKQSLLKVIARPLADDVINQGSEIKIKRFDVESPSADVDELKMTNIEKGVETATRKAGDFLDFRFDKRADSATRVTPTDTALDRAIQAEMEIKGETGPMLTPEVIDPKETKIPRLKNETDLDYKIRYMNELNTKHMAELIDGRLGKLIKHIDEEHYKNLNDILNYGTLTDFTTKAPTESATGFASPFRAESLISRAYSVVRGVVSARYVMTEGGFQALRNRRVEMLKDMLANPSTSKVLVNVFEKDALADPAKKVRWLRFLRSYFAVPEDVTDEELVNETEKESIAKKVTRRVLTGKSNPNI